MVPDEFLSVENFDGPFCSHEAVQYFRSVHTELTNRIKV